MRKNNKESILESESVKRGKINTVNVDFPLGHQSFPFLIGESLKEPLMPHKLFYKTYVSGKST